MSAVSLHRLASLNASNDFQYIYIFTGSCRLPEDTPLVWFNTEVDSCKDVIVCFCPSRYTDYMPQSQPFSQHFHTLRPDLIACMYLIVCLYPSHGMEKHLVQEELEEGEVEGSQILGYQDCLEEDLYHQIQEKIVPNSLSLIVESLYSSMSRTWWRTGCTRTEVSSRQFELITEEI